MLFVGLLVVVAIMLLIKVPIVLIIVFAGGIFLSLLYPPAGIIAFIALLIIFIMNK